MCDSEELEEAKKRLEESRKEREKRRKNLKKLKEPKTLISGQFDELEQKRLEKQGDDDE